MRERSVNLIRGVSDSGKGGGFFLQVLFCLVGSGLNCRSCMPHGRVGRGAGGVRPHFLLGLVI